MKKANVISFAIFLIITGHVRASTITYEFLPGQSTVIYQNWSWGYVHKTFPIAGSFQLTVDFGAQIASFDQVDANLSETIAFCDYYDQGPVITDSLDTLFHMTELVSTGVNDVAIDFIFEKNIPTFPFADVHLKVTFLDDLIHLTDGFSEPCYDCGQFDLDAVASRKTAVYYVDDDGPADFNSIQAAIDDANDGDTIIVSVGTYYENINFKGKNIVLTSTAPTNEDIVSTTIINGNDVNSVVTFSGTEDGNCVISGFTITDGNAPVGGGIYGNGTIATIENSVITCNKAFSCKGGGIFNCDGLIQNNKITFNIAYLEGGSGGVGGGLRECDGTIRNNNISDNGSYGEAGLSECDGTILNNLFVRNGAVYGGVIGRCDGTILNNLFVDNIAVYGGAISNSDATIINCTIVGNYACYGSALLDCNGLISNCIIWQNGAGIHEQIKDCSIPIYSCIEDWSGGGLGNISAEPNFLRMGYWQDMGTYYNWVDNDGDYHLKSQAGRWDPNSESWVKDDVTSPCIDAGDPASPIGYEPFPNGGIINMGAYGGTAEASKSYFGEPVCETIVAGDINGDCVVNFKDFALMTYHWLEEN